MKIQSWASTERCAFTFSSQKFLGYRSKEKRRRESKRKLKRIKFNLLPLGHHRDTKASNLSFSPFYVNLSFIPRALPLLSLPVFPLIPLCLSNLSFFWKSSVLNWNWKSVFFVLLFQSNFHLQHPFDRCFRFWDAKRKEGLKYIPFSTEGLLAFDVRSLVALCPFSSGLWGMPW